jgi:hypothetical protein
MRNRFQVARTSRTGHGTPLTALMSPHRSSSWSSARKQKKRCQGAHKLAVQAVQGAEQMGCRQEHWSSYRAIQPSHKECSQLGKQSYVRTVAVIAQAADAGLAPTGR